MQGHVGIFLLGPDILLDGSRVNGSVPGIVLDRGQVSGTGHDTAGRGPGQW